MRPPNWQRLYSRFGLNLKYGFILRKPKLLARLALNGLRLAMGKSPLLRTVDFAPTYRCNFHCTHCFAENFKAGGDRREMAEADFHRTARAAMALGAVHFAFQGGEPLILKNLEEIVQSCCPSSNLIAVTTNAFLLTPERIAGLKRAGVDMFTISLDSGDPEKHDRFRRCPGAYQRAVQAAEDARRQGMGVTFNTVVSHNSVRDADFLSMVEYTRRLSVKLNVLYAVPIGAWGEQASVILTSEDKAFLDTLFAQHPHLRRDLDANYIKRGCGAMKEVIYIGNHGDVMPCPFIHASMGNVFDEPLEVIWRRGLTVDHFRQYAPVCLAAEDNHFIDEHLSKSTSAKDLPIPGRAMFPELDPGPTRGPEQS